MRNKELQVSIISDAEHFELLQAEWQALWVRANGQYHESFPVCLRFWQKIARPRGGKLRCIIVRQDGALVAVWPLAIFTSALWKVLRPLNSEAADYTTILIDPNADASSLTKLVWEAATRRSGADFVRLPYVDMRSELYRLARGSRCHLFGEAHPASIGCFSQHADWSAFVGSLGTLSGKKPGMLERRLAKQGELEMRMLTPDDAEENERLLDWTLARKREWALRVQKQGAWLYSSDYRNFLLSLLNSHEGSPIGHLYLITLNGEPVVTTIIGMGSRSIKGLLTGFDDRLAKFSPGQLVVEQMVKWAFEHRVDFDFGVGAESFKSYWSRDNTFKVTSGQVAVTPWGSVAFHARELVGKRTRARVRSWRMSLNDNLGALRHGGGALRNEARKAAVCGDAHAAIQRTSHSRET